MLPNENCRRLTTVFPLHSWRSRDQIKSNVLWVLWFYASGSEPWFSQHHFNIRSLLRGWRSTSVVSVAVSSPSWLTWSAMFSSTPTYAPTSATCASRASCRNRRSRPTWSSTLTSNPTSARFVWTGPVTDSQGLSQTKDLIYMQTYSLCHILYYTDRAGVLSQHCTASLCWFLKQGFPQT